MAESEIITLVKNLQERLEIAERNNAQAHKEIYKDLEEKAIRDARTDEKYNNIMQAIARLEVRVDDLTNKPAKRFDSIVAAAISAIVGGVIGYLVFNKS